MNTLTAARDIKAGRQATAQILVNIAELADWNPALLSTQTRDQRARLHHPYPVRTRVPGRATLTYTETSEERVTWRLDVMGGVETGIWDLCPHGSITRVTHTMIHTGPLFTLMRNAMVQVPTWRLDRLQERAEQRG